MIIMGLSSIVGFIIVVCIIAVIVALGFFDIEGFGNWLISLGSGVV